MSTFSTQNHFDILELGQSFSFLNYLPKQKIQTRISSYFSSGYYQEEPDPMSEELEQKIVETREVELGEEQQLEGIQGGEDDGNQRVFHRKTMAKWDDHFQIPYHQLCYSTIEGNQYAYELQFSQQFYQNKEKYPADSASRKNTSGTFSEVPSGKQSDRKRRVQRYLEKKAKRCYVKKISYACRKTVADQRIRVKGRFVNKKHAEEMGKYQNGPEQKSGHQYYLDSHPPFIKQI